MSVDWNKAPEDAEFFSLGRFGKHMSGKEHYFDTASGLWKETMYDYADWYKTQEDFEMRPQSASAERTVRQLGEDLVVVTDDQGNRHYGTTDSFDQLEIDDPVWVKDYPEQNWYARHYAGNKETFLSGMTSFSNTENGNVTWRYWKTPELGEWTNY